MSSLNDSAAECNAERIGERDSQGANGAEHDNLHDAADGCGRDYVAVASTVCRPPITELQSRHFVPVVRGNNVASVATGGRSIREELLRAKARAEAMTPEERAVKAAEHDAANGQANCHPTAQTNTIRDSEFELLLLYCRTFPEILAASKEVLDDRIFNNLGESTYRYVSGTRWSGQATSP